MRCDGDAAPEIYESIDRERSRECSATPGWRRVAQPRSDSGVGKVGSPLCRRGHRSTEHSRRDRRALAKGGVRSSVSANGQGERVGGLVGDALGNLGSRRVCTRPFFPVTRSLKRTELFQHAEKDTARQEQSERGCCQK